MSRSTQRGTGEAVDVSLTPETTPVEIRVHGVGNHDLLSALGSPRVHESATSRIPALVEPPEPGDHQLLLLNWSRMSRNAPTVLWYLAFPFTLLNLARAMQPVGRGPGLVHRAVVWSFSVVLTAATAVWVLAIVERLLFLVDLPDQWIGRRPEVAALCAAALLCLPIGLRAFRRPESPSHRPAATAHGIVVGGVCVGALVARPAQREIGHDTMWSPLASQGPSDRQVDAILAGVFPDPRDFPLWLDPIALSSYATLLIAVLAALILAVNGRRAADRAPAAGAGLACVLAGALLSLLASSSLIGLGKLVARYQDARWIPVFGTPDRYDPAANLVVGRFSGSYAADLVAAVSAAIVIVVVGWLAVLARPSPFRWRRAARRRGEVGRWIHLTVGRLPALLYEGLWWVAATCVLLFMATYILLENRYYDGTVVMDERGVLHPTWPSAYGWLAYGSVLVSVAIFFTLRSASRLQPLREGLALIADVAGFWAITVHPLGARTYRPHVVAGVLRALRRVEGRTTVLVGHSQGSVICAWALARPAWDPTFRDEQAPTGKPDLVTCGSPLQSLYATFFPRHFGPSFFSDVRAGVHTWVNYWRETDPIASPIQTRCVDNVLLVDPPPEPSQDARGHSDYWVDPVQEARVRRLLAGESRAADVATGGSI